MQKLPTWCAIEENWISSAYKVIEPDKEKRKIFWDAYNKIWNVSQHYDCIYTEE